MEVNGCRVVTMVIAGSGLAQKVRPQAAYGPV